MNRDDRHSHRKGTREINPLIWVDLVETQPLNLMTRTVWGISFNYRIVIIIGIWNNTL